MGVPMNPKFDFPRPSGTPPVTPMVYVKDRIVWEYKVVSRNVSKQDMPSEEELNKLGKEGWELTGMFSDNPFVYLYFKRLIM